MFDNVMKGGKKQEDINFAPLDRESEGGLGGTSEDVFGPLVRRWAAARLGALTSCQMRASVNREAA